MIFPKKRLLGFSLCVIVLFNSCQQNSDGQHENTQTSDSVQNTDSIVSADAGLLGSDSGIVVVEIHRNTTQLLGFWQQMPLTSVKSAIQTNAQLIVNRIVKDKYKMEGGLTVLYKEFPKTGSVDVFVGIPVKPSGKGKMPALSDGFLIETLDSGTYIKATVNAEPGETLSSWKAFSAWMKKRGNTQNQSQSTGQYPYFEYFQDSRNAEMTTTVAQAVLIMKKS